VREILTEQNARGTTILISSHILSEVERTAHRVGILYGGRLVAEDTVAAIGARLQPDAAIDLDVDGFDPALAVALRAAPFVREVKVVPNGSTPGHGHLRIAVTPEGDHRRAVSQLVAAHGGLITAMREERVSLEEAFVQLTSENAAALMGAVREPDLPASTIADFPARSSWRSRLHPLRVILLKDLLSTLFAPGVYGAVALGMLTALLLVRDHLDAIERSRVLILADAFTLPFFAAAVVAMLFLTLSSVATIAREREQGTLEALFYGPVDHASYVLAKCGAQIAAYVPMALAIGVLLLVYAGMTGLRLAPVFPLELLVSLFTAGAVASFGVLLSTLTRSARAAFALFGALVVVLLGVHFGAEALTGLALTNNLNPLLFLRDLLIGVDRLVDYVSPFGLFQGGVDALVREDLGGFGRSIGLSVAECALLLWLAVGLLRRRGVRR
jgi:ABC-type transport system involved in multi-copper enzyme maturation permease subunit